jgi:hypothetical protein
MTGQHLEYLLVFLNSKLSKYIFSKLGTKTGVGTIRWKKFKIEELPVPKINPDVSGQFMEILREYRGRETLEDFDIKMNRLIYSIYGLTPDEISIIEREA